MSDQVLVNARYLHHRVSGVQRYAHEVVSRLGQRVNLFSPKRGGTGVFGHIWEQVILPLEIGKRNLLWSPANTGPLTTQNQVVTIHDLCVIDHPEWFDPKFSAWYRFLLPRLAERVIKVITDSDYSRERILELFSLQKDRVVAIPLGVDTRFRPTPQEYIDVARSKYGIEEDYLAVIGSLQPRKNLTRLFQAWKQIHTNYKSLQLVVVGGTGHTFRDAGFIELPRGVNLTGYVKDTDLPIVCVRLLDQTSTRLEIGSDTLENRYGIIIDIFATSDGQRIDLADFILNELKDGWTYYTYSQQSGNKEVLDTTSAGRCRVMGFVDNRRLDLGGAIDKKDRHRHTMTVLVRMETT